MYLTGYKRFSIKLLSGVPLRNVPREIVEYIDRKGRVPFRYWLERLKDRKAAVLLIGGDKKTQSADIKLAQQYWADYLEE